MPSPQKLISSLGRRVRAFEGGERTAVLGAEVVDEMDALQSAVSGADGGLPMDAAQVIALVCHYRSLALPPGQGTAEHELAMSIFAQLFDIHPSLVPIGLRPQLVLGDLSKYMSMATTLLQRGMRSEVRPEVDGAVALFEAMVAALPEGEPIHALCLNYLGVALRTLAEMTGDRDALDRSIDVGRDALDVPAEALSSAMFNLSVSLRTRHDWTGRFQDCGEAILLAEGAIRERRDDSDLSRLLSNHSALLCARFEKEHSARDLTKAVDLGEQAVAAVNPGDVSRHVVFSNLGYVLWTRFSHEGRVADLERAISLGDDALAAEPLGNSSRAMYSSHLGNRLRTRFEIRGTPDDLHGAVTLGRAAVEGVGPEHSRRPMYLSNLSLALRERFDRHGAREDIDDAVRTAARAVALTAADSPDMGRRLSNLALAHRARADLHAENRGAAFGTVDGPAESDDLSAALTAARRAVSSSAGPELGRHGANLANIALVRFGRTGSDVDLETAVEGGRTALGATPEDHPDHGNHQSDLGVILRTRFDRHGDDEDLREALRLGLAAVGTTTGDHPDHAVHQANLAQTKWVGFGRTRNRSDFVDAVGAWSAAADSPNADSLVKLSAARQWARAVAQVDGVAAALDAYTKAIAILPLLAWPGLGRRDQLKMVRAHGSALGREACASAIAAGRLDEAVTLLEAGRGIYWSRLLELRGDLDELRAAAPDLADELIECRAVLDRPAAAERTESPPAGSESTARSRDRDERMRAALRFEDLTSRVRGLASLPGASTFLRRPTLASLLPPGATDRIVIVNVCEWRCDALVVSRHGVELVALASLTSAEVTRSADDYLTALQRYAADRDQQALDAAITGTLAWLWDTIAKPVLDACVGDPPVPTVERGRGTGDTSSDVGLPRVWWSPTGALTLLPLHAAGHHRSGDDSVLDRVVSSYAPTLRASHRTPRARGADRQLLAVSLPRTPGRGELSSAETEADFLRDLFDADDLTVLSGGAATRAAILAGLEEHRWFHASCHGTQDLREPLAGGLVPYDWQENGRVSVPDMSTGGHAGDLAFLAACKTATGGVGHLDEAITLASAMHHNGWRHVIGALWSVGDAASGELTRRFYPSLGDGNADDAPRALHRAVRSMRDDAPGYPSSWMPFIHVGG